MNILIIGTTDILGGAAKVSWTIKESLEREGHTVSMFVADKRSTDPHVKVIPRQKWRKLLGFLLATEDLLSTDWIIETGEFKNADIVHCHNLHGRFFNLWTLQKMSLRKPVVWTLHDEWALTPHCAYTMETKEMKNGLYVCPSIDVAPRLLWDNSDRLGRERNELYGQSTLHIVTPSKWLFDRAATTVLGAQDLRKIENGINADTFKKTPQREARIALNLPLDKKIVLFLAVDAKNNTWKGWKYTQDVINRYEGRGDVLFLNVGNHVQHDPGSNIEFRGHVSKEEELALYYSAADALLFTSIAENFPLVILEAMACGLPIVSFDVGGVKEAVLHEQNGFIAEYLNTDQLAEGLKWALALTPEEVNEIARISRERIEKTNTSQVMVDAYRKLYLELITRHGK